MEPELVIALVLAAAFAATNGLHDASNAIATLVATRAGTPLQGIVMASVLNLIGPFVVGAAVADTIGGIVTVAPSVATEVIGSGLAAAVAWNLVTLRFGLPSSSGHALVGGLVGASLAAGGVHAVEWGGLDGYHPVGVIGTLIALAISPLLGAGVAAGRDPGASPSRAPRDPALARAGPGGGMGDVRRARVQPRRERRAEVGGRDRRAAARGRAHRHARGAGLGDARLRGRAHRGHGPRRMEDHAYRGPGHLSHPADRRAWPARPHRRA